MQSTVDHEAHGMKLKHLLAALGIGLSLSFSSSAANALSFTLTGQETPGALPADFDLDVLGVNKGFLPAYFANAAHSGLGVDGPGEIKFTFMGEEACFDNTFEFGFGNTLFSNSVTSVGTSITLPQLTGGSLLDLAFTSDKSAQLRNGDGAAGSASIAIVLLSAVDALILFNDDYAGDADYDDMIIRVELSEAPRLSEVPLPGALLLFGSGLLGLAGISLRSKYA